MPALSIDGVSQSECNLPSNLLDDVPNESSALAQVTLGAGNTGLDNARGGFLNSIGTNHDQLRCPSSAHHFFVAGKKRKQRSSMR